MKTKLNLSELKVKSFVTQLEAKKELTVKGGNDPKYYTVDCTGSNLLTLC